MNKKNALVVDDTPANRDFLVRLITQAQFNVYGAGNGEEALAATCGGKESIALIMVDMQLPDMSGLQLTKHLRAQYPNALIIMATMFDDYSWIRKSFEVGCDIFLVKPHGFMELFKRLTTCGIEQLREEGTLVIDQYGLRPFVSQVS